MKLSQVTPLLLIVTYLAAAASAWAQEGSTEPAAAEPESAAPEAEPEAEAEAGAEEEAAPAEPSPAQPVDIVVTEHGDWELRCEGENNCFMYQLTRDQDLNPVAEISIVTLPEGGQATAGVTVVTPLGTLLTEGLLLQVDSGRATQYEFGWCTRAGCFARFGLTATELDNMKRGNTARLRIVAVSAADRPVLLNVSLTGFTAAYNALQGN